MEQPHQAHPDISQLRIVLRGISPRIWRRLLIRSDTTLAQLHLMLQMLFNWRNEPLPRFRLFGKDYGSDSADIRLVRLSAFGFHRGERFRYVYHDWADWQCDIRLDAMLPVEPRRFSPVCTGGQRDAPPEHCQDAWAYLEELDAHRSPPLEALLTLADAAQVILEAPAGASIREALGDLDAIREAVDRLETSEQFQPGALKRRAMHTEFRTQIGSGGQM